MTTIDELIETALDQTSREVGDGGLVYSHAQAVRGCRAALTSLQERNRKLEEALTPSAETKAAYIGEVTDDLAMIEENGDERVIRHTVSWTATKEIMAMIRARALLSGAGE